MSNTNGSWIWTDDWGVEDAREVRLVRFRASVSVESIPTELWMICSADTRYKLYINGTLVQFGPAKGDDKGPSYEWIGSPVGPDSIAGKISASYERPGRWSVALNYIFAARGEFASDDIFTKYGWINGHTTERRYEGHWIYVDNDNPGNRYGREFSSPHGIAEYDNVIYVRASWSPLKWLTLVGQPAYIFVFNHNHKTGNFRQGFEMALSCRMDFCRMLKKPVNFDFLLKDKHDKAASQSPEAER